MALGITLAPYGQIPGSFPYGIAYSYGGNGTFLCPDDPMYNTRGEVGFYHDTQLGAPPRKMGFFERMRAKRILRALHGAGLGAAVMEYALTQNVAAQLPPPPPPPKRVRLNGLGASLPTDAELGPTYGWVPVIDGAVAFKEGFYPGQWSPYGATAAGAYGPQMSSRQYTYPGPLGDAAAVMPADQPTPADLIATLNDHNQKIFTLTVVSTIAVATSAILAAYRSAKQLKHG